MLDSPSIYIATMVKTNSLNAHANTVPCAEVGPARRVRLHLRQLCIGLVLTAISFCIVIADAAGAVPGPPKAETLAADQVSSGSARMNAAVSSFGAETIDCTFEYGASPLFNMSAPCSLGPVGDTSAPVSAVVADLAPATSYNFRISFSTVWSGPGGTETGTATGDVVSFSTLPGVLVGPGSIVVATQSPAPAQVGNPVATYDAPPSDGEIICAKSGPPGYLITERTNFKRCGGSNTFGNARERRFFNGIRVYRPKDDLVSCRAGADRVPSGYVVTEMLFYSPGGRGKCGPALSVTYDEYRINVLRSGVVMCNVDKVPEEYVITANVRSRQCGPLYGDSDSNARRISLPHSDMLICDNSRIPPGYLITEVERLGEWLRFGECGIVFGNKEYNAYRIESPPRDGIVICDKSRIPPGYLITEVQARGEPNKPGRCGILFDNIGYNAYRISRPHEDLVICDKSSVPVGWVRTERQVQGRALQIGKCGKLLGNDEYNASRINRPVDGIVMCGAGGASIPDGYVVTERWSSTGKCPQVNSQFPFHAQRISHPRDGMIICGTTVPNGFVAAERLSGTAQCPRAPLSFSKYAAVRIRAAGG